MKIRTDYYQLEAFETVLFIKTFLDWDSRIAERFVGDVQKVILGRYVGKEWCVLHDATEWGAGTPGVEKVIGKMLLTPVSGSLTHHAYVTGASALHQWQAGNVFEVITDFDHREFEHLSDARAWLASAGYALAEG